MKRSTIRSLVIASVAGMMLSGCIFPYWYDDGGRGGGYHDGRGHDGGGHDGGGHRDGGGRR